VSESTTKSRLELALEIIGRIASKGGHEPSTLVLLASLDRGTEPPTYKWKAIYDRPDSTAGMGKAMADNLKAFPTIEEALVNLIVNPEIGK
jgi:hypothetical protein